MEKEVILECNCFSRSHNAAFGYYKEEEPQYNHLAVTVAMNHYLPWYKRIFVALTYIFGCDNSFSHYNEVILKKADVVKVKDLIDEYLADQNAK